MSAMIPADKEKTSEEKSTNVGRFLARRGVLMVKEMREMTAVKGDFGGRIEISSIILSSAPSNAGDVQFGVRLEQFDDEGDSQGSGFLDFDELSELIGALDFIAGVASKMLHEQRDYTEVTYQTKDNLKFGFYQMEGDQRAFANIDSYRGMMFLSLNRLQSLKKSIEAAKIYLVSRGADAEDDSQ